MQVKSYIFSSFLSSFLLASIFVFFSDRGYRGVYWFIWGLTFLISLILNLMLLASALKIGEKFGISFAFVYAFLLGLFVVNLLLFMMLKRYPGLDAITFYYSIFGGLGGLFSVFLYVVVDNFLKNGNA
ncbi:hypothetical protein [Paracidovorax avenae]|uniref:hypothetical protein n=1 Tax=Paracidovorax avenae TaxID=80867 RepID=UPI001AD81FBA|nr:hypothetical protein [Paracidovorax avenae]